MPLEYLKSPQNSLTLPNGFDTIPENTAQKNWAAEANISQAPLSFLLLRERNVPPETNNPFLLQVFKYKNILLKNFKLFINY